MKKCLCIKTSKGYVCNTFYGNYSSCLYYEDILNTGRRLFICRHRDLKNTSNNCTNEQAQLHYNMERVL